MKEAKHNQLNPVLRDTPTSFELDRSDADVVIGLIARGQPLRHAVGYFFEAGFSYVAHRDELKPPNEGSGEKLFQRAVSEILALSHDTPGYVRAAKRGRLLGLIVGMSWFNPDEEIGRVRDAVIATAGFGEEMSHIQCKILVNEIEQSRWPAPVGSGRWALAYVLRELLSEGY